MHKLHKSASIKGKVINNESLVDNDSVFNWMGCLVKQAGSHFIVAIVKHQNEFAKARKIRKLRVSSV